jgi:hypothetical protein
VTDADQTDGPTGSTFGQGAFSKITSFIYWHLIVLVLMCVASLPVVALYLLLARDPSNAGMVPLILILYGPVLSAGLFALRDRTRVDELAPLKSFVKGLRLGLVDSLKAWAPPMVFLALVAGGLSLPTGARAGTPWYFGVMVAIGVIALLWGLNALTIATFFSFRWIDIARLAVYYLGRRWVGTIGTLALLVVATGVVLFTTEAVLWLFGGVFAAFLWATVQPMVADIQARFTASA